MTDKNIWSGFKYAGLIPYSPGTVLQKLPPEPLTSPCPCVPLEFQTPKDLQNLQNAVRKRDEHLNIAESEHLEEARKIRPKINKAALKAFVDQTILQQRKE